ncbi:hypothetical protein HY501_03080 [Candidatus Woesearchaeota archaeon]|nr:hypothetical protein [Candidatus Woesearchaeota archaeon]
MENPSLSFLIGLILSVIVGVFLLLGFLKATEGTRVSEECFQDLTQALTNLKDGESVAVVCSFHGDYALMGFDAKQEAYFNPAPKTLSDASLVVRVRPAECPLGKGCLCLCNDPASGGSGLDFGGCKSDTQCHAFDTFNFISGYYNFADDVKASSDDFGVRSFDGVFAVNISRKGDLVSLCESGSCGAETFNEDFKAFYLDCRKGKDCDCGQREMKGLWLKQDLNNVNVRVGYSLEGDVDQFLTYYAYRLENAKVCLSTSTDSVEFVDELVLPHLSRGGYAKSDSGRVMVRLVNVKGEVCFAPAESTFLPPCAVALEGSVPLK